MNATYANRLTDAVDACCCNAWDTAVEAVGQAAWNLLPASERELRADQNKVDSADYYADEFRVDRDDLLAALHLG